jgi:hypothetical protein
LTLLGLKSLIINRFILQQIMAALHSKVIWCFAKCNWTKNKIIYSIPSILTIIKIVIGQLWSNKLLNMAH